MSNNPLQDLIEAEQAKRNLSCLARLIVILSILIYIFVRPYFEARSFNRFSEHQATYGDAFWTDLRILPQQEKERP